MCVSIFIALYNIKEKDGYSDKEVLDKHGMG